MGQALARHDEVVGSVVTAHDGFVFSVGGDGFAVAFGCADDAVRAAVAVQRALGETHWPEPVVIRVRMGVHVGLTDERDGNYFGPVLNRAARLMAVGHGGQILVSGAARDVTTGLPAGASWRDLGRHRLRDLERAERVWELVLAEADIVFPPLRSLERVRHNLPVALSALIGRDDDVEAVATDVLDAPVVSLVGAGGVGKTRLALAVAGVLAERFPGGVWFVDLSTVSDPAAIPSAVLGAIGVREDPARRLEQVVADLFADEPALLVFDNCEHLIEACAAMVERLVEASADIRVLATSREPLDVRAEIVRRVTPLPVPDEAAQTPSVVAAYSSVELFVACANRVRPGFVVTDANAAMLVEVVSHLDGLPLAIELAAARVRNMTLDAIAAGMHGSLGRSTFGTRGGPERQRTVIASIGWSYALLDELERAVFRRLGIFNGWFDATAATSILVAADSGLDTDVVVDILGRLVDKSLLVFDDTSVDGVYRMLETVRGFAVEQCDLAGEAAGLLDSYTAYWDRWLQTADLERNVSDARLAQVARNYSHLADALRRTTQPERAMSLVEHLAVFWVHTGRGGDALALGDIGLEAVGDHGAARWARLFSRIAFARSFALRGPEAEQFIVAVQRALDLVTATKDRIGEAWCTYLLATRADDSADAFGRAGAMFAIEGHTWMAANCFMAARVQRVVRGEHEDTTAELAATRDMVLGEAAASSSSVRALLVCIELARAFNHGDLEQVRTIAALPAQTGRVPAQVPMLTASVLAATALLRTDAASLNELTVYLDRLRRTVPLAAALGSIVGTYRRLLANEPPDLAPLRHAFTAMVMLGGGSGIGFHLGILGRLFVDYDDDEAYRAVVDAPAFQSQYRAPRAMNRAVYLGLLAAHAARRHDDTTANSLWHQTLHVARAGSYQLQVIEALEALAAYADTSHQAHQRTHAAQQLRVKTTYRYHLTNDAASNPGRRTSSVNAKPTSMITPTPTARVADNHDQGAG
jgi:predicted ATPase